MTLLALTIAYLTLSALASLLVFACCVVAGRADRHMVRAAKRRAATP